MPDLDLETLSRGVLTELEPTNIERQTPPLKGNLNLEVFKNLLFKPPIRDEVYGKARMDVPGKRIHLLSFPTPSPIVQP